MRECDCHRRPDDEGPPSYDEVTRRMARMAECRTEQIKELVYAIGFVIALLCIVLWAIATLTPHK